MPIIHRSSFDFGAQYCHKGATLFLISGLLTLVAFCKAADVPSTVGVPGNDSPVLQDASQIAKALFEELSADATGVHFVHRLDPEHPQAYLYHSGYQCGGVCLGDVNGDGLADIFLVSGPDENALFINRGDMQFEKSSASATLAGGDDWGVGAGMLDVDGDRDLDIVLCNYDAPNRLWLNQGSDANGQPKFTDATSSAGLSYQGPSVCPYFADFDGDGDLDLFLLTNRLYSPTGRPNEVASELGPDGLPRVKEQYAPYLRVVDPRREVPGGRTTPGKFLLEYGYEDRLYRNDGVNDQGVPQFTDITAGSGIENVPGHGLSALIWDVNQDGRPDIYVANDYSDADRLWLNQGTDDQGALQFRDATEKYLPYTTWFSMGSDVADINNDGRLDFMVADMAATTHFKAKTTMGEMSGWRRWVLENAWPRQVMRNMLFVDAGVGRYQETAFIAGVASSDWTWAVKFADFDLDGRNDLFLSNGTARMFSDSDILVKPEMMVGQTEWDVFRHTPEMREKNIVFRNLDGQRFEDQSDDWNLGKQSMSFGAASGDLDGDGDLDLVVCNLSENVSVYRNHAAESESNWLRVKLEDQGNTAAIGALVTVACADGTEQIRLMNPQTGFLSGNEPVLHFGLGSATEIESVTVRWPDGAVQAIGPARPNQLLVIRDSSDARTLPPASPQPSRFVESAHELGLRFDHHERPYDDFKREFLLPGKLSQFGPGLAIADVDGDQHDDVFVGGAAGQSAALFVSGVPNNLPDNPFDDDASSAPKEDSSDDHQVMLPTYRRLSRVPWDSAAASEDMGALFFDADRDGDLDLYVARGSNEWDVDDAHYQDGLYLNVARPGEGVQFEAAPSGALPRMRESASCVVGCDYDRDGDIDLFVGARSIPGSYPLTPKSTLLRNDSTGPDDVRFQDVTEEVAPRLSQAGLVTSGLWSDVNGDGWLDLLVACEWGPVRLFKNEQGKLTEITGALPLAQKKGWWNCVTGADFDGDGDIDYAVGNVGLNTKYGHASINKPSILYRQDMDGNGVFDLVEAKTSKHGELPIRGRSCSCNAMPHLREKFPTYKQFAAASLSEIYTPSTLTTSDRWEATEFASGVWINHSTAGEIRLTWHPLPFEAQISPCYGVVAAALFADGAPSLAVVQNLYSREPETGLWRAGLGAIFRFDPSSDDLFHSMPLAESGFVIPGDAKGLAVADLNADGLPDLVATQNDDLLLAFKQRADSQVIPLLAVRLAGPEGNPTGIGARVQLYVNDQLKGTVENYAGNGFMSQSSSTVYFRRPAGEDARLVVHWQNGKRTSFALSSQQQTVVVTAR